MASMPLNCKEDGCDYVSKGPQHINNLVFHLTKEHEYELKQAWDKMAEWGYRNKPSPAKPRSGTKQTQRPPQQAQEPRVEINPIDPVEELRRILKNSGADKVEAVVDAFRMGDLDDLPKLYKLIRMAGKDKASADLAVEAWAAYRNVEWDMKKAAEINSKLFSGKGGSKGAESDDPKQDLKNSLASIMKERLAGLKERLEMATLVRDAVDQGIIEEDDPVFAKYMPKKKEKQDDTKPGSKDDDSVYGDYEYPPDTGKMVRMKHDDYNTKILGWNRAHGIVGDAKKPENSGDKVQWTDPWTNTTILVLASEFPKYSQITKAFYENQQKIPKEDPKVTELGKKIDDFASENRQLKQMLTDKEKQDLNGQIGYLDGENKKLKEEMEKVKNRDPYEDAQKGWSAWEQRFRSQGWQPGGGTIQDKLSMEKAGTQKYAVEKSFETIADKVKTTKFGTGDNLQTFLNSKLVRDTVDRIFGRRTTVQGGEEIPRGAQEEPPREPDVAGLEHLEDQSGDDPDLQHERSTPDGWRSDDHAGFTFRDAGPSGQGKKK